MGHLLIGEIFEILANSDSDYKVVVLIILCVTLIKVNKNTF